MVERKALISKMERLESNTKMCRACLATKDKFTYYLLSNVPQDLYSFCTSIEVLQDDGLPTSLCDACYNLLTNFSTFKHTCIQSNKTLTDLACTHVKIDLEPLNDDKQLHHRIEDLEVKAELEEHDDYIDNADCPGDKGWTRKQHKRLRKRKKTKVKHDKLEPCRVRKKRSFCFSCEHCNKKFVDPDRFEGHKLMHEGKPVLIRCQPCKKTFSTWYGLSRHKENEHTSVNLERLRCHLCGKISKSAQTLRVHLARHRDVGTVMICDVCGRGFKTKATLKVHLQTHTPARARSFPCAHCARAFYTPGTLHAHARRHQHARFICHVCSYPFKDKFSLAKHLMTHEGKKLYKCELCQKRFASRSSLVEHTRIHSGEKPFPCGICAKRFISRRMMVEHQRIHTGEKPHRCQLCTQAFTQRGTLKRHMRVHEKQTPVDRPVGSVSLCTNHSTN